ncbi:arylsulfotransferase family protein [Embleya sp. NPDC005575]|uniref:arylsulfotransferase family protein n=1 Tax=Embleya sp. NPDC005575 TaxID=3156892 RepID=UPI0033A1AA49
MTVAPAATAAPGVLIGSVASADGSTAVYNVSGDDGRLLYTRNLWSTRSGVVAFQYQGHPAFAQRDGYVWQVKTADDSVIREIPDENYAEGVEHNLTPSADGTRVLLSTSEEVKTDLRPFGGTANAVVQEGVVQEYDLATGAKLFEWKSLGASGVPLGDTRINLAQSGDYLHLNAASYDSDGNVLVSATNTGAVYKLNKSTGAIAWTLGGEHNQFTVSGDTTGLARPQDVRRQADGRLSVFDDHAAPAGARAVTYTLDEQAKTASLAQQFVPTSPLSDAGTGGSQPLPNGNHLVTFGAQHLVREYTPDGSVAFEARYRDNAVPYRVQRGTWTRAKGPDSVVRTPCWSVTEGGSVSTAASFSTMASADGVTGVTAWEVWAGATAQGALHKVSSHPVTGYYSPVEAALNWSEAWIQLRAVGADGQALVTAAPVGRGLISEKYAAIGGPGSWLGNPVDAAYTDAKGRPARGYEHGFIVDGGVTLGGVRQVAAISKQVMAVYLGSTSTLPGGSVGVPMGDTTPLPGGGDSTEFLQGWVVGAEGQGWHAIDKRLYAEWTKNRRLGFPTANQDYTCGNWYDYQFLPAWRVRFAGAELLGYSGTGDYNRVYTVQGSILGTWQRLGDRCGPLGLPESNETATADGVGRYSAFQYGVVYWSPNTGAFQVGGNILTRWTQLGQEHGFLGYPTTDESYAVGGRFNHFQGGSIYWSQSTGSNEVHGSIRQKWADYGWERSFLGFPVTDELATPDGAGRYNHFQGGSIYWAPWTGTHEVHGKIRTTWENQGWERGRLGYPTSDEFTPRAGQRQSNFEGGYILWTASTGQTQVFYTR